MTAPPTTGARPGGRPRDERATEAIAAAARRQVAEIGYARMSMESVAEEAGVSRATVYRRYRDKADLVTSAIAASELAVADAPSTKPIATLVALLEEFDTRIAEHCLEVVGCLLAAREETSSMALHRSRVVAPRMCALRALLELAQRDGALRADADLDLMLEMLVGAVFARRVAGTRAETGWARRAVTAVVRGFGTGGAEDRRETRRGARALMH